MANSYIRLTLWCRGLLPEARGKSRDEYTIPGLVAVSVVPVREERDERDERKVLFSALSVIRA